MPAEMSVDLKQHIIDWYLADQYTYHQIAKLADCSIGHVSNVMRNYQEFAQVKNPFSSHTGHPSQIEEGDIVYLHALLEANPALYLDEPQTRLLSVHNINLSFVIMSSDTEDRATDGWWNRSAPMPISKDLGAAERVSEHHTS